MNKNIYDKDLIKAIGISKSYGKHEVLRDISLEVGRGEIIGLLGPNGSGKTTCFYILIGLIKADAGNILLKGEDVISQQMYQRSAKGMGYLPQDGSIFRDLSVAQNIMAVLEFKKDLNKAQKKERLEQLLEEVGLKRVHDSKGRVLSGGERRRTEMARLLAMDPELVLLDEPFAGVDPISIGGIKDLVRDLTKRNIGVLINDHNVGDTLTLCDRNYVIGEGNIIAQGTANEIVANDLVRKTYLGDDFKL